jgi:flagellar hook protein FlgE
MLRSMNSAISGMQAFQTDLDVVGNNIANVNTVGFKSGRVDFSNMLSQTVSGASAPSTTTGLGGVNAQQVGLGVQVGGIQSLFTQGSDQSTGNATDLAINGSGLFVVSPNSTIPNPLPSPGPVATTMGTLAYTRAGDFSVDANNNLVLPNGYVAMGFDAKYTVPPSAGPLAGPYTDANVSGDRKSVV